MKKLSSLLVSLLTISALSSCATPPPKNPENLCEIFREHRDWYFAAKDARDRWGTPIHVPMSMMYQESSFREDALPPRGLFIWLYSLGESEYGLWLLSSENYDLG